MVDAMAEALGGCEDVVGGLRPFGGLGISVVPVDEGADVGFEFLGRGMRLPLRLLAGRLGEPALDPVGPGGRGRRGVDVPARPPR